MPITAAERQKRYRERHPDRVREHDRMRHQQCREDIYTLLGQHACVRCGYPDKRVLIVDHVNNDGAEHRKRSDYQFRKIREDIRNGNKARYQILCPNCHALKTKGFA